MLPYVNGDYFIEPLPSILDEVWVCCKICYKIFENLARLNVHINNVHRTGEHIYFDYDSYFKVSSLRVAFEYTEYRGYREPKSPQHAMLSLGNADKWFFQERLVNEYFINNIKDLPIFKPESVFNAFWFICKLCDVFHCDLDTLKKHFKTKHPYAPVEYKDCLENNDSDDDDFFPKNTQEIQIQKLNLSPSKSSIVKNKEASNLQKYVCQLCFKPYDTASDLRQHAQKHFQFYCCVNCDQCFRKIRDLKKHMLTAHELRRNFIREDVIKANPTNSSYDCLKCNKHFVDEQYYDAHICRQAPVKCSICENQVLHCVNIAVEKDNKNVLKKRNVCRLCAIAYYMKHSMTRKTILTGVAFILNKIIKNAKKRNTNEYGVLDSVGVKVKIKGMTDQRPGAHNSGSSAKEEQCVNCNGKLLNPALKDYVKKTLRTGSVLANIQNICDNVRPVNIKRSAWAKDDLQADICFCDTCGTVAASLNKMKEHMIEEHGINEVPEVEGISPYVIAESLKISSRLRRICCFCHDCKRLTFRCARFCEEHIGSTYTNANENPSNVRKITRKFYYTFLYQLDLGVLENINYFTFCIKCRTSITEEHIDNCKEKSEEYIIKFGRDIVYKGIKVLLSQVIEDLRDCKEEPSDDVTSSLENIFIGNEENCNSNQQNMSDKTPSSPRKSNPAKGKSLLSKRTPMKKGLLTTASTNQMSM